MKDNQRLLEEHLTSHLTPELRVLSERFAIKVFGYRKFLNNGNSFGFTTNHAWNKIYRERFAGKNIELYQQEFSRIKGDALIYFERQGLPDPKSEYQQALYDNDLWNSLVIYRRSLDFIEGFYFAKERDSDVPKFTKNDIDQLEKLTQYLQLIIENVLDEKVPAESFIKTVEPVVLNASYLKFQQHMKRDCQQVTQREIDCVSLRTQGKSIKRIGLDLGVSHRTVENHIRNAKSKLKINSTSQLIEHFKLHKMIVIPNMPNS